MTDYDKTLLRSLGRAVHSEELAYGWQRAVCRALKVGDTKVSDVLLGKADLSASLRYRARAILKGRS